MAFRSIHTPHGLREIARAAATSAQIQLVAIAVGDGGGNPVTLEQLSTGLVRERWRANINRIYQAPGSEILYIAEVTIPAAEGGWTIREAAIIDSGGATFTVCNLPDSYKPLPGEGTASDYTLRIAFQPGNADTVAIEIDPNVTLATHSWVIQYFNDGNVFPGGTTGQVLTKQSNADGDADWQDIDAINVTVDTIEETQTLAAGQTVVDLLATTTRGLAVYIDGIRLRADQWTKDEDEPTRLTLATSYPAGTKLVAAQNEPTGNAPDPLLKSRNLADLPDKIQSRANLGVYSKVESDRAGPVGMLGRWPSAIMPTGWAIRDGSALSRAAFPALYAVIGTTFGAPDEYSFNLPDDRGLFDGNADLGRGLDAEMVLGQRLDSTNKAHGHAITIQQAGDHTHGITVQDNGDHQHQLNTSGVRYFTGFEVKNGEGTLHNGSGSITSGTTTAGRHAHAASAGNSGTHAHAASASASGGAHARPNTRAYVPIIRVI